MPQRCVVSSGGDVHPKRIAKAPSDRAEIVVDFGAFFGSASASTLTVSADDGITVVESSLAANVATVLLSGGEARLNYDVVVKAAGAVETKEVVVEVAVDGPEYALACPLPVSAAISASGVSLAVMFDRPLFGTAATGMAWAAGTIASGAVSGSTITYAIDTVYSGEAGGSLVYDAVAGDLMGADCPVASFTLPVTNNSTQIESIVWPTPTAAATAAGGRIAVTWSGVTVATDASSAATNVVVTRGVIQAPTTVTGRFVSGSTIEWGIGPGLLPGESFSITYTGPSPVVSEASNPLDRAPSFALTGNNS